jgi:broad specificity phosphatase PhoE
MARIVLIRPGRTDFDEQRRLQGTLDIPLSDAGNAEVLRLARELETHPVSVVYTSPCQAARQTAETLADALDAKLKELDQLQNLNHGLWQGRCVDEVRQTQPTVYRQWQEHPESVCPPGGETVSTVQQRIRVAVTKLLRKHAGDTVAVIAPEPLYSLLRCELTGAELPDLWRPAAGQRLWEVISVGEPALAHTA